MHVQRSNFVDALRCLRSLIKTWPLTIAPCISHLSQAAISAWLTQLLYSIEARVGQLIEVQWICESKSQETCLFLQNKISNSYVEYVDKLPYTSKEKNPLLKDIF